MTPFRHGRNISALLPRLGTPRLRATAVAAVCSTHKRKRNPAPAACASALWPKVTPRQWLVSFAASCFPHCQWAALSLSDFPASQRGYKPIPAQTSGRHRARKQRGFSSAHFLPTHLSINLFPMGEKASCPFCSQCTPAPTLAEAQLRNAACAPEESVPQVLALHHRTVSI